MGWVFSVGVSCAQVGWWVGVLCGYLVRSGRVVGVLCGCLVRPGRVVGVLCGCFVRPAVAGCRFVFVAGLKVSYFFLLFGVSPTFPTLGSNSYFFLLF